ncbi:MAG: ABC transporter ATP-binding protein [Burkholderiaceae bacterium]
MTSSTESSAVLSVSDLRVRLHRRGAAIAAVNGISFELQRGECLTVIGESGSGKSVMLRSLIGLLPANAELSGRAIVDGLDLRQASPAQLRQLRGRSIAMIFQEPSTALDPVFTIGDQIMEMLRRFDRLSGTAARRRAIELLELVSIPSPEQRLRNYPHEMSGGMRQRAVIALALACNPKILLADEPTTALDATVQMQLLLLLRKLRAELDMAVIFVTHDIGVAAEISDRVAVMYAGRFVEVGSAVDVLTAPAHPYTRGLMAATVHGNMRGKPLRGIEGSPPNLAALPAGCAFAARCGYAVDACRAERPELQLVAPAHRSACLRSAMLPPVQS